MSSNNDDQTREAKAALDRVERDSEVLGASSVARVGRKLGEHFSGADAAREAGAEPVDPMEVWGRRIGRFLSLIGVVVLTVVLGWQLGWW